MSRTDGTSIENLARTERRIERMGRKFRPKPRELLTFLSWQVFSLEAQWGKIRGLKLFESALKILQGHGFLKYKKTEEFSNLYRQGIDFEIWGIGRFKCYFTVDVTTPAIYEGTTKADITHTYLSQSNHHIITIGLDDGPDEVMEGLIKLLTRQSNPYWHHAAAARIREKLGV